MCKFKTFKFNLCCCLQEKKIRGHRAKLGKGLDFFFLDIFLVFLMINSYFYKHVRMCKQFWKANLVM